MKGDFPQIQSDSANTPLSYLEENVTELTDPPSYSGLSFRELILCNGMINGDLKAFSSYENYRLYKDFSKRWITPELLERAKYNQNLTKGLPLLVSKRAWNLGFGDFKYLKLYECLSTPEETDRLYKSIDDRQIATVSKSNFFRYTRFRLQYSPNHTIVIFYHHLLEIMDFEFNQKRFRFLKTDLSSMNSNRFAYDFFLLAEGQPSLLDDMTTKCTIAKSNKLLGTFMEHMLRLRLDTIPDTELISPHLWGKFQSCKKDALFSRTVKTCTFSLYIPVPPDLNLNSSVCEMTRVFTAVCLILKNLEIDIGSRRSPVVSPFAAGPPNAFSPC